MFWEPGEYEYLKAKLAARLGPKLEWRLSDGGDLPAWLSIAQVEQAVEMYPLCTDYVFTGYAAIVNSRTCESAYGGSRT